MARGVPFRRAHEVVGGIVRELLTSGRDFESLTPAEWRSYDERFGDDAGVSGFAADDLCQPGMGNRASRGFRWCRGLPRRLCARVLFIRAICGFRHRLRSPSGPQPTAGALPQAIPQARPEPDFRQGGRLAFLHSWLQYLTALDPKSYVLDGKSCLD